MPATPAVSSDRLPGISVSEAFGLPKDWSLSESLKGASGDRTTLDPEIDKAPGTPEPDEMENNSSPADASADETAGVDADKQEADRIAAEKLEKQNAAAAKAEKKAADEGKPDPKAEKKAPKTDAKKLDPKATSKAASKETPAAAAPKKIKIGDEELSEEEWKARLSPAKKEEVAPKIDLPETKKPEPVKEPTAEEKAATAAAEKQQEQEWLSTTAKALEPVPLDEAAMDKILTGGAEGVAALNQIRREDMARTILAARKDMFAQFQPLADQVASLHGAHMQSENTRMENALVEQFPHLGANPDILETARSIAGSLMKADPDGVRAAGEQGFLKRVGELTTDYIRKYNPEFGKGDAAARSSGQTNNGSQQSSSNGRKEAAATTGTVKRKSPPPPAANLPVPTGTSAGGKDKGFAKEAIASMM